MTSSKAQFYISKYNMQPHPEGGFFSPAYRSDEHLNFDEKQPSKRALYSSIYFLITKENPSLFHKLLIDEIWHLYEGELNIHTISEEGIYEKNNMNRGENPLFQFRVLRNTWMAAETDTFAFFGCTLTPGFEFKDFEIGNKNTLLKKYPQHRMIIELLSKQS